MLLQLTNLHKRFGTVVVADGINLGVPEGQALGVLGPNGAGKSSLFNLITGNLSPDAGEIHLAGRDVTRDKAPKRARAGIGRSFQIPQPFSKMSVYENLLVGAVFGGGLSEHEAADSARKILKQTELLKRANQMAGSLGLLERKRLEMARAMATQPRLLLLDEIAGGLTEFECDQLVETISGLSEAGVTIIWIEHVVHALLRVVEKLVVLNFGSLIAEGKPDDVMNLDEVRSIYMGLEA